MTQRLQQLCLSIAGIACLSFAVLCDGSEWRQGQGYRSKSLGDIKGNSSRNVGFTLLDPGETGIRFTNQVTLEHVAGNRILEIGSGVALGDIDGDGHVDVYVCGLKTGNKLFRNLGQWKFEDWTDHSGLGLSGEYFTGAALVDLDGDGALDCLLNSLGGGTRLFRNDGRGRFKEDLECGLVRKFGATSSALGDVDGDGDLDLYVTNYRSDTFLDHPPGLQTEMRRSASGEWLLEPRARFLTLNMGNAPPLVIERGEPDLFYLNLGKGKFVPVPWPAGVFVDQQQRPLKEAPTDWGMAAMLRDLNGDGLPDLYVCNDFVHWPDRLWFNRDGNLLQQAPSTAIRSWSVASMAVDVADVDRDGDFDLFTVDMLNPSRQARFRQRPDLLLGKVDWPVENPEYSEEVPRNVLQLNRGDGTFAEIGRFAGVTSSDWSPSTMFLDVDLDGWEDLLIGVGNWHDVQDVDALSKQRHPASRNIPLRVQDLKTLPPRAAQSRIFRNRRDLTFEERSSAWGFDKIGIAQGMAMADLDGDGDQDVVVNCMNESVRVYRNESVEPRILVQLTGDRENSRGVGAKITVRGGPVAQSQEIIAGGRYASSDDPSRTFATGVGKSIEIEVAWRDGKRTLISGLQPNFRYHVLHSGASAGLGDKRPAAHCLFQEINPKLEHRHVDLAYDDRSRQRLLPFKQSSPGPGLAWIDLDQDGGDELVIGAGKGGGTEMFRYAGVSGFQKWQTEFQLPVNERDQTAVVHQSKVDGQCRLIVGESNWEDGVEGASVFRWTEYKDGRLVGEGAGPALGLSAAGVLAQADVDSDGDLEIFVGGRVVVNRYPEAASSVILGWSGNRYDVVQRFDGLGMVQGAVFTDFDGDGDVDLAVAVAWSSIRLFRNDRGHFVEATREAGLDGWSGLWNGITAGDFDGDGRMDLAASNWGLNWRLDQNQGEPKEVALYFGEFAGDEIVQPILASLDPQLGKMTPWRDRKAMVAALPFLSAKFPDHASYSRASIEEMIDLEKIRHGKLTASFLASSIFLNRGGVFVARELPREAQFSPAFGIVAADFDGDGMEDLFLAQNFFGADSEITRSDAGSGLVLLGNGRGDFRALTVVESGINIAGEQRGCAVSDYDGDGRVDLAVGQNRGETKLYRNSTARQGLRVRLQGDGENRDAIGASVRVVDERGEGPAREIRSGSGWLSQDSLTQVFGIRGKAKEVIVKWPGGKESRHMVPSAASAMNIQKP